MNHTRYLMSTQSLFAPILMAFVLVAGFFSLAAVASSAASAGKSVVKARESSRAYQLESTGRRDRRIPLPIGPSYIYYDYPYYYSRGYYPTHIGGYVYYPAYSRAFQPRYNDRCASGRRSCVAKTGHHRGRALPRRIKGARR
jgi:hypothetical protein